MDSEKASPKGTGDVSFERAEAADGITSAVGLRASAPQSGRTTANLVRPRVPTEKRGSLALPAGYRLHEYRIERVLGQGGFGITYLAVDVNLRAKIAIKEYLPRVFARRESDSTVVPRGSEWKQLYEEGLQSFLHEARTLATFRHPNIVRVARFFEANGTAYIVLEYERGESLKTWWPSRAGMRERDLLSMFAPLLEGLAVVHRAGFLHRDVKPDNICVRDDDGSLVLLDFGSAREVHANLVDETVLFTPGYAPIEQYTNEHHGPWTDIYAIGATFYWMIAGKKPNEALERFQALERCEADTLPSAVTLGAERYGAKFLAAIDWALKPLPSDRPTDIDAFRRALFAEHAAVLNVKDALAATESDVRAAETLIATLKSPRLLWGRTKRAARSLVRPGSWPLAVKLTLAMVATALAPMLITAEYNLRGSVSRVSQGEVRNLEQLAGSLSGRIAQLLADSRNLAEYLATDDDFVAYLAKPTPEQTSALKTKLDRLVQANHDVQLAMVFDTNGTAVVSSDADVMGKNFKFREYFTLAMAGQSFTTGIMVGAVAGQPGVFFSNPVRDPSGKVIGAVVLRIKGRSVAGILDAARQEGRTPFLIDGDGVLIHHPDATMLYRSLVPLSSESLDRIKTDKRFRRDTIESVNMPVLARAMVDAKSSGNVSYTSTISGKDEIAGYAPVKGHNWVVGVTETRDTFEGPLQQLFANVLKTVALVGAIFLVLATLLARTIVRPIQQLTRAAHALKSGDYEKANVRVTSADEVGQLARVFNVLIDVLRQRDREPPSQRPGSGPKAS